jgi:hypothetical protein
MTRKVKGHAQGTPAQPSKSTEWDAAATIARDDCLERLRRVAEDAVNFKIRLFHAPEDSAVALWTQFTERKTEWLRESSDALKAYVEVMRGIFPDMEKIKREANKNWDLFKPELNGLLTTVREIFEQAGAGASTHDDETKRWNLADVERAIQGAMAKCELELTRAGVRAFRSAEVSIAQEKNRRVQESSHVAPKERQVEKLPKKKTDLSHYADHLDAANLTVLQREVFLLHLERRMSFASIAEHLGKDRSTVREHFKAARKRIDQVKRRAATRS